MTVVRGVGIDLLEPARLEAALARRPALGDRLFTEGERAYAARRARPIIHLAARFSAKEAVAKALRLSTFEWCEIEVLGGGAGTGVALRGSAEERRRELGVEVALSLTHVESMAGAVAALVPRDLDGLSRRTTKDAALPGRIRGHEDDEDGHQRVVRTVETAREPSYVRLGRCYPRPLTGRVTDVTRPE